MPNEQEKISPQSNTEENQPEAIKDILAEPTKEPSTKISPLMAVIGIVAIILMWLISTKIF